VEIFKILLSDATIKCATASGLLTHSNISDCLEIRQIIVMEM